MSKYFTKVLARFLLMATLFSVAPFAHGQEAPVVDVPFVEAPVEPEAPAQPQTFLDALNSVGDAPSSEVGRYSENEDNPESQLAPNSNSTEQNTGQSQESEEQEEPPPSFLDSDEPDPNLDSGYHPAQLPKTDESTGALVYEYALVVPPGRNGLQPDLRLQYNSQNSTQIDSQFGAGWTINIPYIERVNKNGADKFYGTSTFASYFNSSLDGELATTSATSTYISRVENGNFNSYTFTGSQWLVTDKNGTQYKFGYLASTTQADPFNSANVFKWMLEEVRDANNNFVRYEYYKDGGQIYPSKIVYTGNNTTDGVMEVNFVRESRTDISTSTKLGFQVITNHRISEINTQVSSSWVHKYSLAYTTGDNGRKNLLSTITESGRDESGNTTTLPATTFTYQAQNGGWVDNAGFVSPVDLRYSAFTDVNGDGYGDIVYGLQPFSGTSTLATLLNDGEGDFATSTAYTPPWELYIVGDSCATPCDAGARFADVNGDGLTDFLVANDKNQNQTWLNTGSGWVASSTWDSPIPFADGDRDAGNQRLGDIADMNNDGLPDIFKMWYDGASSYYRIYFNNGNGWTLSEDWSIPLAADVPGRIPADLNGDGMSDFIRSYSEGVDEFESAWISNGTSTWVSYSTFISPTLFQTEWEDFGARIFDLNRDGLQDINKSWSTSVGGGTKEVYLNTGNGWLSIGSTWASPVAFVVTNAPTSHGTRLGDLDGDNNADVINVDASGGGGFYASDSAFFTGKKVDVLTGVSYPSGGRTEVVYKAAAQYTEGSNLLNPNIYYNMDVVDRITSHDGISTTTQESFTYKNGKNYFNNPLDRKFAGFGEIDKTDAAGNVTKTYFHQADVSATSTALGEYNDNFWKIGKPYRVEKYDSSGNLFEKIINRWDSTTSSSSTLAGFVKLAQSVSFTYDGDGSHKDLAGSYTYNTNGDTSQKIEWGQVTGSDDGSFSDTGSDKFTTDFTYSTSATSSIVSLPKTVVVTDQSASKVKEDRFYYDNLSLGVVDKGNQTKHEQWKTASTYVDTEKTYNSYGLVTTEKDPRDKTTTYSYDTNNLYPAVVTNSASLVTRYIYDYSSGNPATTTDANGTVFVSVYDGLDRLKEQKQPNFTATSTLETVLTLTYTDTFGSNSVKKSSYLDASTTADSYVYFDGLGRKKQERKEAENSNYAVRDFSYNNLGLLQAESLPYFSAGLSTTTATTTSALFTNYTYDALMRPKTTANILGTTTNTYADWKITVTDANGETKDLTYDAYKQLIQVDEHNASSTYTTTYTYNGLGGLLSVTDALGNVRNFTYDGLGRRLTAQDLHSSGDGTYGTYTYTYDDSGNLTQKVDPKSQTVNFTYDDINRVLTEDYTAATGTEVTYTYDSCTFGKGSLCTASSTAVRILNAYNPLKLVQQSTSTISGTSFTTAYTYDRQGNQLTITNPDNSQVKYVYNSAGLLNQVQRKESGDGSYTNVVSDFDYSPTMQIASATYANGVVTENTHDQAKLYRLTRKISTLPSASKAQDMSYTYDAVGNITQLVNSSATNASSTVTYSYDDLNRLTSATATGTPVGISGYTYSYTYDALGNILSRTENGTTTNYSYLGNLGSNYANPHAVTAFTGAGTSTASSIALDVTSTSISNGYSGGTTKNWSHTTGSGSNRLLVLTADLWQDVAGAGTISSATYGGVSLTKATSTREGGMQSEIWYLVNPSSGTATTSVTISGDTDAIKLSASTYTGAIQTSPLDVSAATVGDSGNPSISLTTGTANDLIVSTLSRYSTTGATTSKTSLFKDLTGSTLGAASYQLATTTGSYSDTYTGSAASDWSMVMAAFKPNTGSSTGATSTSFTYDNNGNTLTTVPVGTATTTYTWDYNNRLTQTVGPSSGTQATSTFSYDPSGQRVKMTVATTSSVTTYYPTKFYSVTNGVATKHVFTPDGMLLATISNATSSGSSSIALDATSTSISNGYSGTTTKNWSHTTGSGSNRMLVLSADLWQDVPGAGSITAATYNGVSLTKATSTRETGMESEIWYLVNPASGSNTVSVTVTGDTDAIKLSASTYTGVTQSSPVDVSKVAIGTSGNPTISATTVTANDLLVATLSRYSTTGATSSRTSLYKDLTGSTFGAASYQIATSTGSYSDTYTGNAAQDWSMVMVGFKPASGGSATTTVSYILTDHLGGTNVILDSTGAVVQQLSDYYPYGNTRLDEQNGANEQRKAFGLEFDNSTGLIYANARYYEGTRAKFLSQDPMFWATPVEYLVDPQQWNSYSYARNNPIVNSDPTGNISIGAIFNSVKESVSSFFSNLFGSSNNQQQTAKPSTPTVSVNTPTVNTPTVKTTTWDPVSDKRISQLDSRIQQPAVNFINDVESQQNTQLRVVQGYRSIEEQNKLYNQGRTTPGNIVTNAKGGDSYHNYGLAFDVVVMEKGQPNWNKPINQNIANIGAKQGFEWGGTWSTFPDYPHFQMTFGQSLSDLKKGTK